jgi:hypothetical protein
MEITVQLPDDVAKQFGGVDSMPQQLLEAFAIESYRSENITRHQVGQLLGLDYWETDAFLAQHKAKQPYTLDDLEVDRASLSKLDEKRGTK